MAEENAVMFYVLSEPEYESSCWYQSILGGLLAEKRQRRVSLSLLAGPETLPGLSVKDDDAVFLIGTDTAWISRTVSVCEAVFSNRVVVLGSHARKPDGRKYSIVTSDVADDVRTFFRYLSACGRERIALYGVNPGSASDAFRAESFLSAGGRREDILPNDISLAACFSRFLESGTAYDGVICVNEYAAISLLRHLREEGGKSTAVPYIVSCGGSLLSRFFSPSVTHTEIRYDAFGRAGFDLLSMLIRHGDINAVTVQLSGSFVPGETTEFRPLPACLPEIPPEEPTPEDRFYSDAEIDEMRRIGLLLNGCTDGDLLLLERILAGDTYESVSSALFLSTNGIKYKLRNMFSVCGVKSRAAFSEMLGKYIARR